MNLGSAIFGLRPHASWPIFQVGLGYLLLVKLGALIGISFHFTSTYLTSSYVPYIVRNLDCRSHETGKLVARKPDLTEWPTLLIFPPDASSVRQISLSIPGKSCRPVLSRKPSALVVFLLHLADNGRSALKRHVSPGR
jgi:hypothetical protein